MEKPPERMPTRIISRSPEETEALGVRLAEASRPGMVWGLSGELGAGKTAFVRGFARGMGCSRRAHSPTFALLHEYGGGRCPVHHLDLYRLSGPSDITAAGLEEYLIAPPGIALVEWIDRWNPEPDGSIRHIRFKHLDETTREIIHDDPGH
jgi:tRNA threonylcarbamoyladenosine biosynthesis protein TsaE